MRKISVLCVLLGIVALAFLLALQHVEAASTYYVPGDYGSIQAALNGATDGDTIIVRDGIYYENVGVNKRLTIRSENGSENCVVNASNPNYPVFQMTVDYVNISGFTVENATGSYRAGICLYGANYCNISQNNVSNNDYGIYLDSSDNNIIIGNTISNNSLIGVSLFCYDEGNVIVDNTIINNSCAGIKLENMSNYNLIEHNYIGYNGDNYFEWRGGILIFDGCGAQYNNTIRYNILESNRKYGVYCMAGSPRNNSIYHNNFINNTQNAYDECINIWDNGYPSGGNYWDDYTGVDNYYGPNQDTPGSDGIGDTPYNISGGSNVDRYPLMHPWQPTIHTEDLPANESVIVDAIVEADTTIEINSSEPNIITIVRYDDNPEENLTDGIMAIGKYIDVIVANESNILYPVNITIYYTQNDLDDINITEDDIIGMYYWNESALEWQLYNDTGVNTTDITIGGIAYAGYVWALAWNAHQLSPKLIGAYNPQEALENIKDTINNLNIRNIFKRILKKPLNLAIKFLNKADIFREHGKEKLAEIMERVAILKLKVFQKIVNCMEGKCLTEEEANTLISMTNPIIENLQG